MAITLRVVQRVIKTFPSATPEKVLVSIERYRKDRDAGKPDWEGHRTFFRRVLKLSIKNRHH